MQKEENEFARGSGKLGRRGGERQQPRFRVCAGVEATDGYAEATLSSEDDSRNWPFQKGKRENRTARAETKGTKSRAV